MKHLRLRITIILIIVISVLLCVIFVRELKHSRNDIINEIVSVYDKEMVNYTNKIDEDTISSDGITLHIESMVLEDDGVIIKYKLIDKENDISSLAINSIMLRKGNKSISADAILNFKSSKNDDRLAFFKFSEEKIDDYINNSLDISISFLYAKKDIGAVINNVMFSYTPTNIYRSKEINIDQSIKVDNTQIELGKLEVHKLYTAIDVKIDSSDNNTYVIELKDQNGIRIKPISGEMQDDLTNFYFEALDEKITTIYVEVDKYTLDDEKGKLVCIPVQQKPIETNRNQLE